MRLWQTYREAGRPIPTFSDDDVLDYMVVEALMVKMADEKRKEQDKQKRDQWRKGHREFNPMGEASERGKTWR